jgi:hypothetical protein
VSGERDTFTGADILRRIDEPVRVYAWSRPPTDEDGEGTPCEALTPGCSIDHARDDGGCEPW